MYGDDATLHAPLGTASTDDVRSTCWGGYNVSYGTKTNLPAALKLAVEQFSGPGRRPNAPKVILIMSSFYNPESVDDPITIAEDFKASGGIIINFSKFLYFWVFEKTL